MKQLLIIIVFVNLCHISFSQADTIPGTRGVIIREDYSVVEDSVRAGDTLPTETVINQEKTMDYDLNKPVIYQRKIEQYTKLKKSGNTMAILGTSLIAGGLICMVSADWDSYSDGAGTSFTTDDPAGIAGLFLFTAGIPLTITGAVLGSVGRKKSNQYKRLLENLSVNMMTKPDVTGFRLVYRF